MSPTDSSSGNRGVSRGLILTAVTIASVGVVLFVVMGVILVGFKKYRYTQQHPGQQRDNCHISRSPVSDQDTEQSAATVMDDDDIILYSSPVSNNSETKQDEADMTRECEVHVYSSVYSEICETTRNNVEEHLVITSSSVEELHVGSDGNVFQSIC